MKEVEKQKKQETVFLNAVLQGLKDVEEGRVMSLEAAKARIGLMQ